MDFVSHSISCKIGAMGHRWYVLSALLLGIFLILGLFLALNVQPAFSQDGSPQNQINSPSAWVITPTWVVKQTVDATPFFANMTSRALAFNRYWDQTHGRFDYKPCAAYGGDHLYYSCYISGTGWTPATTIDPAESVGEYASLTFYDDIYFGRRPAITYYDSLNGRLKLAYNALGIWHIITVPAPIPPYAATGGDQNTSLSQAEKLQKLQEFWDNMLPGQAPSDLDLAVTGVGKYSSLDIDRNGGFHITYYDEYDQSLMYAYTGNPTENESDWVFEKVDGYNDQGKAGLWTSVKVDASLDVHVAYMSEKYDDLKYAYRNHAHLSDPWTVVTVDSTNNVGSMGSLVLSAATHSGVTTYIPNISYLDFSTYNLKYAQLIDLGTNQWFKKLIDKVDSTGLWTSIAYDGNYFHISYYDAYKGDLKYATGRNDSWTVATIQKTGVVGWYTSIAVDPRTGMPGILYYDASTGDLLYTNRVSGPRYPWSTPEIVSINSFISRDVGRRSSLAVRPDDGAPFISYFDMDSGLLKYLRSYYWSSKPMPLEFYKYYLNKGTLSGAFSSIKLDKMPDDTYRPRIAYYDSTHYDLRYAYYNYKTYSWGDKLVDWRNDVGQYASLAIGSNHRPQISYYDATNKNLMYAIGNYTSTLEYYNITSWYTTTTPLDSVEDVGKYTSIALNSWDLPIISYYDESNGDLKLAYRTLTSWLITTVDDGGITGDDVGRYTSLALDSLGNPHISYYDYTDGKLMYIYWQGNFPSSGDWSDPDDLYHVGGYGDFVSSLKINPVNNTRHLCFLYYPDVNQNAKLMYAQYTTDSGWVFWEVDKTYDVGYDCSLDLNSAGQPAISYYDRTGGDLKFASSYEFQPTDFLKLFLPVIFNQ